MNAVNATRPEIAAIGAGSLRARLDLLLQHTITLENFEADVTQLCQANTEEIWTVLALLDQYHRRGLLPTPLFRSLKASADRRGLGRQGAMPAPAPAPPTAPPALSVAPVPQASVPVAAPATTLPPGTVLRDRYVLEELLGRGARGAVYRALDRQRGKLPQPSQQLALKILHAGALADPGALASVRVEFQCAQSLAHPNIVNVYDLEQDGPLTFMTMELLDGEPLSTLLERYGRQPLPRAIAMAIIRDIGAALVHAHERGVVHGDLQPRHIMITANGEVRVTNFAAARTVDPGPGAEISVYACCEALEGQLADRRDDLYALACISYELLAGHHPFNRLSAAQARGRALLPRRPALLARGPWRALRSGLAWRRENRTVGIGWWLSRMNLRAATAHLPALRELQLPPTPGRRSVLRPALLLSCLGVAIAAAATLDRLPTAQRLARGWSALTDFHFGNPLQAIGDWLSPAPPAPVPVEHRITPASRHPTSLAGTIQRHARGNVPAAPAEELAATGSVPASAPSAANVTTSRIRLAAAPSAPPPPRIELAADSYTVLPGEPAARVEVRRRGSLQGDVSFVWSTESASAQSERDFVASGPRAEQMPAGVNSVTLLVPIVSDATRTESRVFYVTIGEPGGGAELGPNARASVLVAGGN